MPKSTIITLLPNEFAEMLKTVRARARDSISLSEPEGYSALSPDAVRVADACTESGMGAMQSALEDWAFDYLNTTHYVEGESRSFADIDRENAKFREVLCRLRDTTSCTQGQYAILDEVI